MPDLVKDLGYSKDEIEREFDKRACFDFKGGEDAGLRRVKEFIWDSQALGTYVSTRNELTGSNYSSRFSPWMACGAISPRYAYFETVKFAKKHGNSESTKSFINELFWRDFCRFWCY
jgi:deoxyribodipyrimidine photo-lyase